MENGIPKVVINDGLQSIDDFFKHYDSHMHRITLQSDLKYEAIKRYRAESEPHIRTLTHMRSKNMFTIANHLKISMDQVYSDFYYIEINRAKNREKIKLIEEENKHGK